MNDPIFVGLVLADGLVLTDGLVLKDKAGEWPDTDEKLIGEYEDLLDEGLSIIKQEEE